MPPRKELWESWTAEPGRPVAEQKLSVCRQHITELAQWGITTVQNHCHEIPEVGALIREHIATLRDQCMSPTSDKGIEKLIKQVNWAHGTAVAGAFRTFWAFLRGADRIDATIFSEKLRAISNNRALGFQNALNALSYKKHRHNVRKARKYEQKADPVTDTMTDRKEHVAIELAKPFQTLADEIHRHRTARGLTQTVFAQLYGFTQSQISNWEEGARKPNKKSLTLLRKILELPSAVVRPHPKRASVRGESACLEAAKKIIAERTE